MSELSTDVLEHLYRSYAPRLRAWVTARGVPPAESEDLVQEVYLQAFLGWRLFRGDATPATWLFRIAERVVGKRRSVLGGHLPRVPSDDVLSDVPSEGLSPLEDVEYRELASMLDRALHMAGPQCRDLLMGQALGEDGDAPPSADQQTRPGTIWVRRCRARKKLVSILRRMQRDPLHRAARAERGWFSEATDSLRSGSPGLRSTWSSIAR